MKYCLLFSIIVFTACSTQKVITDPNTLNDENILLSMSKGACFGTCPVYTLNIYDQGYCVFKGKRNVEKKGTFGKQLSKEAFKAIKNKFEESNFSQFEKYYESNIPDLPSVAISYKAGEELKEVVGKRERPEAIHRLQFLLEQIAESQEGWTLIEKSEEPDLPAQEIKSEIILTTNGGPNLTKWFDDMRKEHGLRIVKKLSNSLDMWLVSFNPKKNTPEQMLDILQNDEFIKSAQFNVKTEKR